MGALLRRMLAFCAAPALAATCLAGAAAGRSAVPPQPAGGADVRIWRLDCGAGSVPAAFFSDTFSTDDKRSVAGVVSCYLVRHGTDYLLWDAGLSRSFAAGNPAPPVPGFRLGPTMVEQLGRFGVQPEAIRYLAISHAHFDHIGQASDFPRARLLLGAPDLEAIRHAPLPAEVEARSVAPWAAPTSDAQAVTGDLDVFGDGSVIMLATPGHTAGHHSLLVRRRGLPTVLLTGDLFHTAAQVRNGEVSARLASRADELASVARVKAILRNLNATLIVSHEAGDVTKLPAIARGSQ